MIRFISFFFLLSILMKGRAAQCFQYVNNNEQFKEKNLILKLDKVFSNDDADNKTGFKRKYRPKGTEVSVPHIETITFEQRSYHTLVFPLLLKEIHSSFRYHANHKRGPPLV
jgi:hypothetical protein